VEDCCVPFRWLLLPSTCPYTHSLCLWCIELYNNTRWQCNVMGSGLYAADVRFCVIQFLMEIFVFCIMKTVTVIKRECKITNSICQFITESWDHLKVWNFYILSHATPEKLGQPWALHIYDLYVWYVYCASGTDLLFELSGICVNHWHRLYTIVAPLM
jgi:hypothetical protein